MSFSSIHRIALFTFFLCVGTLVLIPFSGHSASGNPVHFVQLNDDSINPVTAQYIVDAIDQASVDNAECLVVKMDTPGGLLSSTRTIVKKILTSTVPVVVYIAPSGSRAGSAGVFITYASHIAAMAPSTNIGAAHPVEMGGKSPPNQGEQWRELRELIEELRKEQEAKKASDDEQNSQDDELNTRDGEKDVEKLETVPDDDPMSSKILQDTVAFIKAIAQKRDRNVDWAVDSVVKSASITDEEALEKGVIEIVARDDLDLLKQLDGRIVEIDGQEIVLETAGANIVQVEMRSSQRFFNVLANPNVAYFLMILGFYGLLFEITNPGIGVPGILGAIFLILAFYSMQTLPTNYAGLALMGLGFILLIAEAYTPTFGLLTLGGLVCLVLGSMLLFETADPVMRVSRSLIYSLAALSGGITLFLLTYMLRNRSRKALGGQEGLIGEVGVIEAPISGKTPGKIFIHSELWNAVSEDDLKKGESACVTGINGMNLLVEKISGKEQS